MHHVARIMAGVIIHTFFRAEDPMIPLLLREVPAESLSRQSLVFSLWFDLTAISGCLEEENSGANYLVG